MLKPFNDVDLHAYVDKQVGADRRVAIATYLALAPDDAARVDLWSRQNEAVKTLYATGATDALPLWLTVGQILSTREASTTVKRRPGTAAPARPVAGKRHVGIRRPRMPIVAAVAFAAGLVVALAAGHMPSWAAWQGEPEASRGFEQRAIEAHRLFALDPDHPTDVPPAQLRSFLQARVSYPVRIPDLQAAGWALIGGRIVPTDSGAGALLVYGDSVGDRLSLVTGQSARGLADEGRGLVGPKAAVTGIDRSVRYAWMTSKDEGWLEGQAHALRRALQDASGE